MDEERTMIFNIQEFMAHNGMGICAFLQCRLLLRRRYKRQLRLSAGFAHAWYGIFWKLYSVIQGLQRSRCLLIYNFFSLLPEATEPLSVPYISTNSICGLLYYQNERTEWDAISCLANFCPKSFLHVCNYPALFGHFFVVPYVFLTEWWRKSKAWKIC